MLSRFVGAGDRRARLSGRSTELSRIERLWQRMNPEGPRRRDCMRGALRAGQMGLRGRGSGSLRSRPDAQLRSRLSLQIRVQLSGLGRRGPNTVSPAKNARGEWAPILIVHGVRDARVPVDQAPTLVRNPKSAGRVEGRDFVYLEQPKNTRNVPYDSTRIEWLGAAAAWIVKHIRLTARPVPTTRPGPPRMPQPSIWRFSLGSKSDGRARCRSVGRAPRPRCSRD